MQVFANTLLKHLSPEVVDRLGIRPVNFELFHEIEFPGNIIDKLYFVESGMASMTVSFLDGTQVEAGMFGYESVIGVSALIGSLRGLNRVYTQIAGHGFCCSVDAARLEFNLGQQFQSLTLRYVQAQLLQAIQSTGCNARHSAEERLARWLLICSDRVHSRTMVLSQELIAQMLGATRSTVSVTAGILKGEGLIDYNRGVVTILDSVGLEARACECYRVIREHLDNYAEFDAGFIA
jgi:CRP-like cAMP-binding protein